ncbi:hypothetical protein ONS95_013476 [Cadophora gregata]|uniref:uncharacterized protein n=1 Tax=Cadophora gregata TaxID=51156 RepID=UPI0026DD4F8D|nr:uncharacterized protein ONS95_013476 [Cadophora gregata]KAK0099627.1 hypothetical protein ONS96_008127 [Cadophora gregata f. sp. sojae]KAK0116461.1 hypothetical protein ONS95_013476 [Cadophora gregata]
MAVPPEMTLRTLNGKFTINKTYSDSVDKMMALQGFPYLMRMAARTATIELTFTSIPVPEAQSPTGPSKLKIATLLSAVGMSLGKEKVDERHIDGVAWEEDDGALGLVVGRAWWCPLGELSLDFEGGKDEGKSEGLEFLKGFDGVVKEGRDLGESKWRLKAGDGEGIEKVVDGGDEVIRLQVEAKKSGALADHVWGFETGFGEGEEKEKRRYTRRMLARKGDKVEMAKLVYDYLGPS